MMTGCARQQLQQTVTLEKFQKEFPASHEQNRKGYFSKNAITPAQAASNVTNLNDYVLGAGDLITISVFETDKLNTEARVSSRGFITMPLLGKIQVQGLTANEAEEKIEEALIKNYMHEAHVTLFVKERVSQQITLVGAVEHPGTYETKATKRILAVLALAGGLTKTAGDTAYVTRHKKNNNGNEIFLVDLEQLLKKGRVDMDMFIHGGDVIFVPQSDMVQVDGAVRQTGPVKIDGGMFIDEAIAAAGGLAQYADDEDIKLIRKDKEGKRQIIQLSMQEILDIKQNKKTDVDDVERLKQTLMLQDGDVIFAEASGTKSFYSGVGFTLGFLGTGVSYRNPGR